MSQSFVDAIEEGLTARKPELILLPGTTGNHTLYVFANYLRLRANSLADAPADRTVRISRNSDTQADVAGHLAACRPGDLVVCPELRDCADLPSADVHLAAEFVRKGATVFAVIHGGDIAGAQRRIEQLWGRSVDATSLPPYRFITFAGRVERVPVTAATS